MHLEELRDCGTPSLVDQVVRSIRSVIQQQRLQPGDRLPPEPSLIQQLGVSRTVVREAIGQLQTIGLLDVRRGCGTFVNDPAGLRGCVELVRTAISMSAGQLRLFTELRTAMEIFATRKAAEGGVNDEELAELERLAREAETDDKSGTAAMLADGQFHLKLVELADNSVLSQVMDVLQGLMVEAMVRTTPQPRPRAFSLKVHLDIIKAIRRRDPDAAQKAVQAHMGLLLERLCSERPGTMQNSSIP